jgi:hypothetical protein
MDAPNAWSAQPVFGYERFPLPKVHPESHARVSRDLPSTSKVKRPVFAFPPPEMTPDETGTAFANTHSTTTTERVLDAADAAFARLPSALLLTIGVLVGVLGAYGILSAIQADRVTPRVAATVVHESPRPAILAKPTLVTSLAGVGEASTPRRAFAARHPVRRPAR